MKKLNLGCGDQFNSTWTNVDISPRSTSVLRHDLRQPLPFDCDSFDIVYHSHVLEHFDKQDAPVFLEECVRVLSSGGVIRVVVPDLERIIHEYLKNIEICRLAISECHESRDTKADYDWILLELYDQTVRNQSGGAMLKYLQASTLSNREYVLHRIGNEAKQIFDSIPAITNRKSGQAEVNLAKRLKLFARHLFRNMGALRGWRGIRRSLANKLMTIDERNALTLGLFRNAGEIHQWMYDSFSLHRLLQQCGLIDICVVSATDSKIHDWKRDELDSDAQGNPHKPDSLYMEAKKP